MQRWTLNETFDFYPSLHSSSWTHIIISSMSSTSTSIRSFALVQFILAELDLDDFPEINSLVQVHGGGYTGLPSSFSQDVLVHGTFSHNQDSEQGIFAKINWDQLQSDSERDLCLGRGLFQKSIHEQETKEELTWGSQWLKSSFRGKGSDKSAFLFISSPEVSEGMVKNINSAYQKALKDEYKSTEEWIWEPFSSSRSAWNPIDFAVEFERRSVEDDTEEVRTSRSDVSLSGIVPYSRPRNQNELTFSSNSTLRFSLSLINRQ